MYPNSGPPVRKSASPVAIGVGICSGCGLIAVIAIVALSMFAITKSKGILAGIAQQRKQPILFFKAIKVHDYAAAEKLMSPEGQKALPQAQLKKLCEDTEQRLGPLQSWSTRSSSSSSSNNSNPNKTFLTMYRSYHVMYQYGGAIATFYFSSNSHLAWSRMIGDFNIATGDSTSDNDARSSTPSGESGKSNSAATKKSDPNNDFNQ